MPFRLTNTVVTFQRYIKEVLNEFIDIYYIVYLDNVLIYSKDEVDYEYYIKSIIKKLVATGLYRNPKKCIFSVREVSFLGFVITPEAV